MPPTDLSPKMQDVARLVAEGWTTKQIAAELHVTPRRVRVLITAAVVRLGLTGRDDRLTLALWYREHFPRSNVA